MESIIGNAGLSINKNGDPKQTIGNCIKAICYDARLKEMFRFNEMTGKTEIFGAWWNRLSNEICDNDVNNIRLYLEQNYGLSHEKNIPRAIDIISKQHPYHPIREYLNNLKWDGVKRIGEFLPKYLGAQRSAYTTAATQVFLMGAIERVFKPGIKYDLMLCIADTNQGGGKSTIARFLAVKDEWFTDDLKRLDDENVYRKLQGHWVIEFSEMLATAKAKTVEDIKSFITRQKDNYKLPYAIYSQDFPRQCVFIGTSNDLDFLPNDKSGNRRFVPVLANSKVADKHPLDDEAETRAYIDQLWAEAMYIYRNEKYQLTFPKELQSELLEAQSEFTPENPKIGVIQKWLEDCPYTSVCSLMIYKEAFDGKEYQDPKDWELKEISQIMNKHVSGWEKRQTKSQQKRFHKYGVQRAWDKIVNEKKSGDGFESVDNEAEQMELPFEQ